MSYGNSLLLFRNCGTMNSSVRGAGKENRERTKTWRLIGRDCLRRRKQRGLADSKEPWSGASICVLGQARILLIKVQKQASIDFKLWKLSHISEKHTYKIGILCARP